MSWISIGNLRRFTDKLFHSALTFDGSVTHNGADEFNGGVKVNTKPLEINGGVKVNTTKAEFNAPVAFTGTTTYKGSEIATKSDVSSGGSITVDDTLSDTSTNPVQNKVINSALKKKLDSSGFAYERVQNTSASGTATKYFTNRVEQSGYVNDRFPFLEVGAPTGYSEEFGDRGKVSLAGKNIAVYKGAVSGSTENINGVTHYARTIISGDGVTVGYSNTKDFKTTAYYSELEFSPYSIRLAAMGCGLNVSNSGLTINGENVATESYVKSAIAAIASYDDTAF